MKRVLITGKNSYIGTAVERWLLREPENYVVDTIDMKDEAWVARDFSGYDVVFHVAAIVHQRERREAKAEYFRVNADLPVKVAAKAKADGVNQFIFMSTMGVYGENGKVGQACIITRQTVEQPTTYYGMSKLKAERDLAELGDSTFKIVVLRPPLVYGRNCPGNYLQLSLFARKAPMFPLFDNIRSMLHIDNLCEFIRLMIGHETSGRFFPQDAEYVSTSQLVKTIAKIHGRNIYMTRIFNPAIVLLRGGSLIKKVFGNMIYEKSMSDYDRANYRVRTFSEAVWMSEMRPNASKYICTEGSQKN